MISVRIIIFNLFVWTALYGQAEVSESEDKYTMSILQKANDTASINPRFADSVAQVVLTSGHSEKGKIIARAFYVRGLANYYQGKYHVSNDYYEKALQQAYLNNDVEFASSCWNNIGINYELLNNFQAAIEAYLKSLQIAEEMGDSLSIYYSHINLGLLSTKIGEFESAEWYLNLALNYFSGRGMKFYEGLTLLNLGILYQYKNDIEEAINYHIRAEEIFSELNDINQLLRVNINLVVILMRDKHYSRAKAILDSMVSYTDLTQDEYLAGTINMFLGEYYLGINEYDRAEKHLNRALSVMKPLGALDRLRGIYGFKMMLASKTGNQEGFEKYFIRFDSLTQRLVQNQTASNIAEIKSIYELDKKIREIDGLNQQVAEKIKRERALAIFSVFTLLLSASIFYLYLKVLRNRKALYDLNMELVEELNWDEKMLKKNNYYHLTEENHPHQTSVDDNSRFLELFDEIKTNLIQKKLFLNPNLSVLDLATLLNTNERYISQAISTGSKMNFNQLVNTFRINEAKKFLSDATHKRLSNQQLADKCGFKSIKTFQRNFKSQTGLTISDFKELSKS